MVGVWLQPRSAEHRFPGLGINARWFLGLAAVDHDLRGRVVSKMRCIDDQLPDRSDERESKQHDVVAGVSPPTGLPALAHRPRSIRANQPRGRGVELIAACHHGTAVPLTGQVNRDPVELSRVGHNSAVDPQSGHAPIGKDRQPDVRKAPGVGDREYVLVISAERRAGNDLHPACLRLVELAGTRVALVTTRLDHAGLGEVAGEEAGVDVDRRDQARTPKADQRPVVPGLAPAARLPSVH